MALARAVAAAPDFLLLDEPFAALDGTRRRAFIRVLLDMHRAYRLPIVVVTHDIEDAAALASHLVALSHGRGVAAGGIRRDPRAIPPSGRCWTRATSARPSPAPLLRSGHTPFEQSLWLKADHVLLAAQAPRAISARNVLEGEITSITQEAGGSHLVELATGAAPCCRVSPAKPCRNWGWRRVVKPGRWSRLTPFKRRNRMILRIVIPAALILSLASPAGAQSPAPSVCAAATPVTAAANAAGLDAGTVRYGETAQIALGGEVAFPVPPQKAGPAGSHAGMVAVAIPAPGIYRIGIGAPRLDRCGAGRRAGAVQRPQPWRKLSGQDGGFPAQGRPGGDRDQQQRRTPNCGC